MAVGGVLFCVHEPRWLMSCLDHLCHRQLVGLGSVDEFSIGYLQNLANESQMDWQTTMALIIVGAAGLVLVYRSIVAAKRAFSTTGSDASACARAVDAVRVASAWWMGRSKFGFSDPSKNDRKS